VNHARILKVVPTLMCGGTENQFMTLSRRLDRARFDLEFACLRRWGPFVEELADRRIPLSEYPVSTFRSVQALAQQARLMRHIARRGIKIVHAYNFYGNVFAVPPARLAAPVVIASIRDCAPYLTAMQKRVQRYACQLADCVLVNATAVKEWLIGEGYDASKIVVIRNGVDLTLFTGPADPNRIRQELGLAPGTPLVAVVSRLTRLKGLENLLEAAAMLKPHYPDVRFLIVGETSPMEVPYLDELKQLADRHGIGDRVMFTGRRSDVPTLLSGVDGGGRTHRGDARGRHARGARPRADGSAGRTGRFAGAGHRGGAAARRPGAGRAPRTGGAPGDPGPLLRRPDGGVHRTALHGAPRA
jgi:glycosyltransferase involved in cell wall biosynthesis